MTGHKLLTSTQAQAAFYTAFEHGDLDAMMRVWSEDSDIVCIHPHGPRLIGVSEIREGWRQILAHSPRMRLKVSELNTFHTDGLAVHLVNENIRIGDAGQPEFTVLATNVYRRTASGWRIVIHHASPAAESRGIGDDAPTEDDAANEKTTIH
jgi:uncharacterized protein (TIGR02246 family)